MCGRCSRSGCERSSSAEAAAQPLPAGGLSVSADRRLRRFGVEPEFFEDLVEFRQRPSEQLGITAGNQPSSSLE